MISGWSKLKITARENLLVSILYLVWERFSLFSTAAHERTFQCIKFLSVLLSFPPISPWNTGIPDVRYSIWLLLGFWSPGLHGKILYIELSFQYLSVCYMEILRHCIRGLSSWLKCCLVMTADMEAQCTKEELQTSNSYLDSLTWSYTCSRNLSMLSCLLLFSTQMSIPGHVQLEHQS